MTLIIFPNATVTISTTDTNLCSGQNTVLTATGSPAGGSYQWSPTIAMTPSAGNTASVTVAPSGTQSYQVIYALNGCSGTATKKVNIYPAVTSSAGSNQTYCLPVTGTITIGGSPTAAGGSGNYKYAWSPAYNLSSTTVANPTITSVVSGTTKYYVTVTDSVTQCTSIDSVTIAIYPTATVTIASSDTNLCTGGNTILTATGSPTGGTYQWSPTTGMSPVAGNVASVTVSPSSTQSYQVIYSLNGCSGNASKKVNIYPSVVASSGGSKTYCLPVSGSITLGGSPTASGGSGKYKYAWSPSTNLSSTSVANPTITSIVAGTTTYKVTVTDSVTLCSSVDSMVLTINPAVIANAGPLYDSVCSGLTVTIGGSPTTGSGGTGTLSYSWAPGTGLSATNISNPSASPSSNTTYSVTVTDSKGCSATSSVLVEVNPNPTASAGANQNLTACSAASVTLGGSPTGSGGTGSLVYTWSPSAGIDSTTVPNPTVSHLGSTTTYRVTVTDSKGCTASSSARVNVVSSTLLVNAGVGGSYCAGSGGSVTLTGSVTPGTAPYTYRWTPSIGLSDTNQITTSASPTVPGSYLYNLNVTDTNGCQASDTVRVTVYPYVIASAGPNVPVCAGFSVTIGGGPTGSGGTGPLSYQWSPGSGLNSITIANPSASPSGNTSYALTVTDSVGCSATSSTLVTVNANPIASAGNNQTFCQPVSGNVTLGGSPTASGGSGSYSYIWSPGTNLNDSVVANPTVSPLVTNIEYHLTVTDKNTGCSSAVSIDSTHLTIYVQPTVSVASSDTSLCIGQSTTLTATGSPTGGTYQWSPVIGMTPVAGNVAAVTVEPSSSQTYQVVYTLNGCTNTADKTVNIYPSVVANAGSNQTYCFPVSGTITIGGSPTASGGSGSYSYKWSPGAHLSDSIVANPTISSVLAGTTKYYVTVTDNVTQCSSVDSMTLTINSTATVTISSTDTNLCSGQSTVLTAVGSPAGGTYDWSPTIGMTPVSGNVATVTVAPSNNQGYQVIYTLNGCSGTAAKTVNVYPSVLAHAGGNQTYCLPLLGTVTLGGSPTASGGSGHYVYLWTPSTNLSDSAAANPTVSGVAENITYHLLVTDSVTGCTSTDTAQININSQAHVTIAAADTSLCLGQSATLIAIGTPGGGSYQWEPLVAVNPAFANKDTLIVTPGVGAQSYVVYYDRAGCRDSTSVLVTTYPQPVSSSGGNQTYCLPVSGTITLGGSPTASGGSGQFTYRWSPGTNLSDSTVANPTIVSDNTPSTVTYTVTISDKITGCTSQSVMTLTINPKAIVTISTTDTNLCLGQSTTLTANVSPSGGIYQWSPTIGMTPAAGNTATVTVAPAGSQTYQIVYDAKGCYDTAYKTVNIYPVVTANAGVNQTYCLPVNGIITLGGSPTASGGSGQFTYSWSPGSNLSDSTVANPTIVSDNTPTTVTYTVTISDIVTGCTSQSVTTLLTISPKAIVTIAASDTNLCQGGCATLTATGIPSGGAYQWEPLVGLTPPGGNSAVISACPAAPRPIRWYMRPKAAMIQPIRPFILSYCRSTCGGAGKYFCSPINTVTLGATPAATGGSGHYGYSWSPGATLNDSVIANPIASPTATTTYYLTVTDSVTGCTSVDSVLVTKNPGPTATITPSTSICTGGSIFIGAGGGTSFIWSNGQALCCQVVNPDTTTRYTVTVTDANGCTASVSDTITVGSKLSFSIKPLAFCDGGGDTINGCSGSDSVLVTVYPKPHAGFFATQVCQGDTVHFTDQSSSVDSIASWFYNFGDGSLTSDTSDLQDPTYVYTTSGSHDAYEVVTTIYGCGDSVYNVVNSLPPVVVTVVPNDTIPYGGSVLLAASGGSSYSWSPTSSLIDPNTATPDASPDSTTTYYVTVTNSNGCTGTDSVRVVVLPLPNVSAGPDTFVCVGNSVPLLGSSTTPGVTYQWSPATWLNNPDSAQPIVTLLRLVYTCISSP
ncbi:unnamed protein product [Sphagnum balticum]